MTTIDRDTLLHLAPLAKQPFLSAFERASDVLPRYGITTPRRLAHALAQWLHETGGLTILEERLSYTAERLMEVWPSRFLTLSKAKLYERQPEALANLVYAGRMGNAQPGDGYRFRGRGLVQLTGRANYARYGELAGVDLLADPDRAASPDWMLEIACSYWKAKGLNELADEDDLVGITRRINGGTIGIKERLAQLVRCKAVLERK
jgi:putative chitinase